MSRFVINDPTTSANSYKTLPLTAIFYYDLNSNKAVSVTQNVEAPFATPTTMTTGAGSSPEITNSSAHIFTYSGATTKTFRVCMSCNITYTESLVGFTDFRIYLKQNTTITSLNTRLSTQRNDFFSTFGAVVLTLAPGDTVEPYYVNLSNSTAIPSFPQFSICFTEI